MMRLTKLFFIFISFSLHAQHYFPVICSYTKDTLVQGDCFSGYFTFGNLSTTAVKITFGTGSAHNIVVDYTQDSIYPGDTAHVGFYYNSLGKYAAQARCITVDLSNDTVIRFNLRLYVKPMGASEPLTDQGRFTTYYLYDSLIRSSTNKPASHSILSKPRTDQTPVVLKGSGNPAPATKTRKFITPPDYTGPQADQTVYVDSCDCDVNGPSFPGGSNAFRDTVLNRSYQRAKPTISGKCYIQFTIDKNGIVKDPVVKKSVDPAFEKILIKEICNAGKWKPACYSATGSYDDLEDGDCRTVAMLYTMPFAIEIR